ncbi:MAG: diaminopimelate decarboxylase, partial [Betaproteobacteria bacterium]|nr:diaminopimelate decarboxylase [Betaproteobacteria bacterium]
MTPSEGILPSSYSWKQGELSCEGVSLTALASSYGTPLYVYSERAIRESFQAFAHAAVGEAVQICFAVKANPNLAILQRLAQLGAGFDIVSGGELERVLRAGADPKQIVFSGVGKTREELSRAMR